MTVQEGSLAIVSSAELAMLVKATVVLIAAILLLLAMRNASASARYLVVAAAFGGLLLLPIASVFLPPIAVELRPTSRAASAPVAPFNPPAETHRASEPGSRFLLNDAPQSSQSIMSADSAGFEPLPLLRAAWLAGAVAFAVPVLIALWRARGLRRTGIAWPGVAVLVRELATQAGVVRHVQVLRHEGVTSPLTCGFWRPIILMPWDAPDWTDTDVRRALIHEIEHVRRGDWPAHLLARLACAGYWFHPMVWTCWRHLHLEAECACDDAVVRQAERATYAAQLVRLAERMSGRDVRPILAMASQGDLAARVRSVLDSQRRRERANWLRTFGMVVPALFGVVLIAPLRAVTVERSSPATALAGALDPLRDEKARPAAAAGPKPLAAIQEPQAQELFESATVRRGITVLRGVPIPAATMATVPPGRALGMVTFDERQFVATGVAVEELIARAYGIGMVGNRPRPFASIEGLPSWIERFDVEARTPRPVATVRGRQEAAELRSMLQHLLASRFQMTTHWEPRPKLVYELRRDGALGPQIRPSTEGTRGYEGARTDSTRSHRITGMPLSAFTGNLQLDLRRPIIDLTGLEGPYSLEFQYSAPRQNGAEVTLSAVPANRQWEVFSEALREQLGLRLEPRMTSEDVLVIDRIALPSYDSP
jgi:uncharacterized protein (TIGR03435 family)